MPELPEVEIIKRGLARELDGDTIVGAEVLRYDSVEYPKVSEFLQELPGYSFQNFERRGKYLLIGLDKQAGLAVHLRMSGRLLVVKKNAKRGKFLRVCLFLKSKRELHFEDMRVFGRIWFIPPERSFEQIIPSLATLGEEPLSGLTGKKLTQLFYGKTQAIKSALLDQRLIAGIGNIYADESLFQANINPLKQAGAVSLNDLKRLASTIQDVLKKAIVLGGSSIKDYVDSDGINGNYQNDAWVYGRNKQPCHICSSLIQRVKIAGRSSHFCPTCQPVDTIS